MKRSVILLVDDNPDDEALTLRAFRRTNAANEFVVARDGVEALAYLLGAEGGPAPGELPRLVLLDLNIPRIDGLEVLNRIRSEQRTRTIPVVVLTSSSERRDIVRSYELGANSYVRKPVDFAAFVEAARLLGEYWLGLNEQVPE